MRRFPHNLLTAVSFLLLAVTVICWGKSLWIEEIIFVHGAPKSLFTVTAIVSRQGSVEVTWTSDFPEEIDWWIGAQEIDEAYLSNAKLTPPSPPDGQIAGFEWGTYVQDRTTGLIGRYIEIPFWAPALLSGLLPGWRLARFGWRWRGMRRAARDGAGFWRWVMRGAFSAAATLSFAVMLVSAFFWARSIWISDAVFVDGSLVLGRFLSTSGSVVVELNALGGRGRNSEWSANSERGNLILGMSPAEFLADRIPTSYYWQGFGFGTWSSGNASETIFIVPHAFLAMVFAVLPLWWLLRFRRRYLRVSRLAAGHCPACGYDLQGSASRACPECGVAA